MESWLLKVWQISFHPRLGLCFFRSAEMLNSFFLEFVKNFGEEVIQRD